jgi:glyoxylase-like metal-dependent hydrolase (beta-lactamase superfamily II)
MIDVKSFTFNAFQENTYIVYDETGEAMIIDPGAYERAEKDELKEFILSKNLKVTKLLNTHCHVDHVLGNAFVKNFYKVLLGIPEGEEPVLLSVKAYAGSYGFSAYEGVENDYLIREGEKITLGSSWFTVLSVPGHSPGHIALYNPEAKILLSGDVLFNRSIGRYDLPGGNYETLMGSIKNKILVLPDDVKVYPGHGPVTNIGDEKKYNPFLNEH